MIIYYYDFFLHYQFKIYTDNHTFCHNHNYIFVTIMIKITIFSIESILGKCYNSHNSNFYSKKL